MSNRNFLVRVLVKSYIAINFVALSYYSKVMIDLKALEAKIDKALSELTLSSASKWYERTVRGYYGSIENIDDEEFISYNTNNNESSRHKQFSGQAKEA